MPDTWLLKFEDLWTLQRQQTFTNCGFLGAQLFPLQNEIIGFFSYLTEVGSNVFPLMNEILSLSESMSKLTLTPI